MDLFFSILIRNLARKKFSEITELIEKFTGTIERADKDMVLGHCDDVNIIACLFKIKESYPEARFGLSQYMGLAIGLSKIAKLGEILISEDIEQKIIEHFEITSLGMLSIEGMASQILVCRIENPKGELRFPKVKTLQRISIPRTGEIELLQNLLRVAHAILVTGPAGSGKTTFLEQLIDQWQDAEIFQTVCPSYNKGHTLKPIAEIVKHLLHIYGTEGIEQQQKIIEERLRELDISDIGTSYLAILDFLGLSEEESILEKLELKTRVEMITRSVADILKRISWQKPVVVIIEDVEHMDASSVNFIQCVISKLLEDNVSFIFSSSLSQVNIPGLKEFELRSVEKDHLEGIIEKSTGEKLMLPPTTPFHVSQYLLLFHEEKMSYFYNQYCGKKSISGFSIPFHDVKTIIKRRLELLEDKRDFLFDLAVAGSEIKPDELPVEQKDRPLFDYFVTIGYLKKYFDYYIFANPLLHSEIYNFVADKEKRHLRLADYYRRIQGFEEQAAFHYREGGNYKKAIEFLMKSATLAVKKGGHESGIGYYNQAFELCQRQQEAANLETLVAINEGLAEIYRALGEEDKALEYYKFVLDSYKDMLKE
ncbi:MAG: AAA family ATPase [candidate division WOR-3 bacterium]|nr:MAG: AAA family ATPase [candidate division WOR-3 bacterium]